MHYRPRERSARSARRIVPQQLPAAARPGSRAKARIWLAAWPSGYQPAVLAYVVLARTGLALAFLLPRRTAVASAAAARAGPGGSRNLAVNQQPRPKYQPPAAQEPSCTRRSPSN
jgi:hypothetical protein